ncbi:MAG: hypothetical protein GX558_09995 [Clostridiales bacterium]|nr:hypothetical protein [Clostridiales bacterium]
MFKRVRAFFKALPQMVYWMALVGVFGVFLLIYPGATAEVVLSVVGSLLLVAGVFSIARYFIVDARRAAGGWLLSSGCVLIAGGALVYAFTAALIGAMPFLFGCALLLGGVVKLQGALDLRRLGFDKWYWPLIAAALSMALGAVLIARPLAAGIAFTRLIGASLVIEAAQDMVYAVRFARLRMRLTQ